MDRLPPPGHDPRILLSGLLDRRAQLDSNVGVGHRQQVVGRVTGWNV